MIQKFLVPLSGMIVSLIWVQRAGGGSGEGSRAWLEQAACTNGGAEASAMGLPCPVETKLTASDAEPGDLFSDSVSLHGDTALVGAPSDDANGVASGSAYVFLRSGAVWTQQAKLTPDDGQSLDNFGSSVSLSGETALIGTIADQDSESAYVFVRSGAIWTQQAQLTASGGEGIAFGRAVSLSGDTALVGATGEDSIGSAYVFERSGTTWTERAKLTPSDPEFPDRFGYSVCLSGDTALISAPGNFTGNFIPGSAYVFTRQGGSWTEAAKLTGSPAWEDFGRSVAVSGDTALIGAPPPLLGATLSGGRAYVFVRSGTSWPLATMLAGDGGVGHFFGEAVSLDDDTALVGAYGEVIGDEEDVGAAYVFVRNGESWIQANKLIASDGQAFDSFGSSVSVSGGTALVGADMSLDSSGSAYVFDPPPPPAVYCTAGLSASGCQASIGFTGIPSATAPSGFSLAASGVEGAKDGQFFFGVSGKQASSWGNGTSFQCVVPPVSRAGQLNGTGTTGLCDGAFSQDLNGLWCPACPQPQKNPGACATVQAQLWYRDPQNTSNQTTSLSDAIEFVVGP